MNLAHGILLIYVTHILHKSINVVVVVVVIVIGTKITNQCYNAYSRLVVVSHWLLRYAQELATRTGEWEKWLDACEIKTIFDEKCGHHIYDPQICGKQFGSA